MSPVETLLAEVLAAHSQVSGGSMRYCVCGALDAALGEDGGAR